MVFFLRITFFEKKTEKKYVYRLWFSVALIYGLYAIIASLSNEGENFLFSHSDQWKFYNLSDKLADSFSLSQIWKACFVDRVNGDNEGAYFLFGVVGYIGKHFFDGNSMMLQMICTSLFSSLIIGYCCIIQMKRMHIILLLLMQYFHAYFQIPHGYYEIFIYP